MQFSAENQRRAGIRVLRPWLGSARMVRLFYRIGQISVTRPGTLDTIEMFVERITSRSAEAALQTDRKRAAG